MERTAQYKTEDGKIFTSRKDAVRHEFLIKNSEVITGIVKKEYKGKETEKVVSFLSEFYSTISDTIEKARPKKNRRTNAKMIEDGDLPKGKVEANPPVIVKKKTKK